MSNSPASPSKRRQPSGQSTQPQPIAPAPAAGTNQPIAPALPAAAAVSSPATRSTINTDVASATANATSTPTTVKSPVSPTTARKRKAAEMSTGTTATAPSATAGPSTAAEDATKNEAAPNSIVTELAEAASASADGTPAQATPPAKKSRTNTPWTPAEERRLKTLRDAGSSWGEIAKEFPNRTEGSVKKHWYKDMHYADFAEDESAALLAAIREYEQNKWKEIGKKVGKPAKACEQYAKENFQGKL